ncbi:hypothetical protein GGU11DRAFT_751804 [Lentinula aff. detonsa]|nr:hypothetical protein GGU11DRAFT_751804 [Lentinula aff. detonsa]
MIEDSDLDHRFWAEAGSAYCYIRGMIPTNRHPGVIPWEKWFESTGRKVNVSHLRRWGCKCWVTDLDHIKGKLGRQAWEGRIVGYVGRRGYRIWDPRRRGVYPVCDVVFEEGRPRRTMDNITQHTESGLELDKNQDDIQNQHALAEPGADLQNQLAEHGSSPESSTTPSSHLPHPSTHSSPPPVPLRRSTRDRIPSARLLQSLEYERDEEIARKENERWANVIVLASTIKGGGEIHIPKSYAEAMRDSEGWLPPMKAEFESLINRGCWSLVDRPMNQKILNGMWVYDLKVDGDGVILKRKARYGCKR